MAAIRQAVSGGHRVAARLRAAVLLGPHDEKHAIVSMLRRGSPVSSRGRASLDVRERKLNFRCPMRAQKANDVNASLGQVFHVSDEFL